MLVFFTLSSFITCAHIVISLSYLYMNESTPTRTDYRSGAAHWRAKLTAAQVREIRARYATREVSQHKLAAEFGVSVLALSNVIHRKSWAHIV